MGKLFNNIYGKRNESFTVSSLRAEKKNRNFAEMDDSHQEYL